MIRGHVPAGQLAVEVGTGTGLITGALDSASRVVCIDRYPDMLRRFDASAMSVSLICADAEALPLAGNIASVVVAANLLHLVPNADAVIAEMGRVARVDGLIVFTWPDPTMSVPLTYRYLRQQGARLPAARFVTGNMMLAVLRTVAPAPRVRPIPEHLSSASTPVVGGLQRLAVLSGQGFSSD